MRPREPLSLLLLRRKMSCSSYPSSTKLSEKGPSRSPLAQGNVALPLVEGDTAAGPATSDFANCQKQGVGAQSLQMKLSFQVNPPAENSKNMDET